MSFTTALYPFNNKYLLIKVLNIPEAAQAGAVVRGHKTL